MGDTALGALSRIKEIEMIPDSFTPQRQAMFSAQAEAAKRTYKVLVGKSGDLWLVARQENEGDHVYVSDPRKGSQGFGGATMTFDIAGGNSVVLQGGWKCNSDLLYRETGYDVRDKHLSQVVVARNRTYENGRPVFTDILHFEPRMQLGVFDRGKEIAKRLANERGERVLVYVETLGGSSSGWEDPDAAE